MPNQSNDPKKALSPREKWDQWRQTEYSDDEIREVLDNVAASLKYGWENSGTVEIAAALAAHDMIIFNEMIETRIERQRLAL